MYEKYKIEVKSRHLLTHDKKWIEKQIKTQTFPKGQRILLEKYFETLEQKEGHVTAICRICNDVVEDSSRLRRTSRNHLKVSLAK